MRGSPRCCTMSASTGCAMAYWAISPQAAPGVDGVTWGAYGQDLEANLQDLHGRVQRGATGRGRRGRAYIPKADGRLRPLGHRRAGGQDRPAGRRRGAERHLRGGLPGLLLRVPAGAQARTMRWTRWRSGSRGRR